jgi:hypothetical protein
LLRAGRSKKRGKIGKRKRPERRTEVLKMTSFQGLGFRV